MGKANKKTKRRGNAGKTNAAAALDAEAHLPNRYRAEPEFDEAGVIKGAPNFAPVMIAAVFVGAVFASIGIFG